MSKVLHEKLIGLITKMHDMFTTIATAATATIFAITTTACPTFTAIKNPAITATIRLTFTEYTTAIAVIQIITGKAERMVTTAHINGRMCFWRRVSSIITNKIMRRFWRSQNYRTGSWNIFLLQLQLPRPSAQL